MYTLDELGSWDLFFFYGQNDIELEIQSDLMGLVLQPLRSLFYNNRESGGVDGYENYPNDLNLQINCRFTIADAVAWKNGQISDGSDGITDRRIAVSQNSIQFTKQNGELNIEVLYIPYLDFNKFNTAVSKIGV